MKITALAAAVVLSVASLAEAAEDVKVKIGVLTDLSSTFSDMAGTGSVVAARMAVEDFGASAKGIKVEIVGGDHQNKPDVGSNLARQWFDRDGVDVIVDVPTSSVALAVSQVAREKNKVLLASGAAIQDLTGKACSPNTIHWVYDTWALANGGASTIVKRGGDTWFFLAADYTFGQMLERETAAVVEKSGGKVLGTVRHPFINADFSSFLVQARASGAKVVGLANSGADATNAIKQAYEFGLPQGGQTLAALLLLITDVHALGTEVAQGLVLTEAFYWDLNEGTRAFAKRFAAQSGGKMPTQIHAGVYSSIIHYLKAVERLRSTGDGRRVVEEMKVLETDDPLFGKGSIRADGRKLHPLYLFEVKKPSQSKGPWDLYNVLATIPAERAFRPANADECSLVKRS